MGIEILPVGVTGRLEKSGELAVRAPLHDAVVGLVHKKNVPCPVARGPLGKSKVAGQFFELRVRRDDAFGKNRQGGTRQNRAGK